MPRTKTLDVVGRLAAEGLEAFTLDDLRARFDLTAPQAHQLAHRLTKSRLVGRIKRGLYVIRSPEDWRSDGILSIDRYWLAASAAGAEPYYLAFYTAMELHDMIQHPLQTIFVAVTRWQRPLMLGRVSVRFISVVPTKFFGDEKRRTAQGHVVSLARLERTFLDCADRPELCGGIEEVFRGFVRRARDVDPEILLSFVRRLHKPVLVKRMGFLLELAGGDPELLLELERYAGRLKRFVPLDRSALLQDGDRNHRWELIVNVNVRSLLAAART